MGILTVTNASAAFKLVKMAFDLWQKRGDRSSNALIQKGFEENGQNLQAAWQAVSRDWLADAEANAGDVHHRLMGEVDDPEIVAKRILVLFGCQQPLISALSRNQWDGVEASVAREYERHGLGSMDQAAAFAKALVPWMRSHLKSYVTERSEAAHEVIFDTQQEILRELRGQRRGEARHIIVSRLPIMESPFAGRDREEAELLARLRSGAPMTAVWGPSGTGKSLLMHQMASVLDKDEAFEKPVIWVSAGQGPAMLLDQCETHLSGKLKDGELMARADAVQRILVTKKVLLCVDGVDDEEAKRIVRALCPGSRCESQVVVTTLDERFGRKEERFELDRPDEKEAVAIMRAHGEEAAKGAAETALEKLIAPCARLPMALGMAGRLLATGADPDELVRVLTADWLATEEDPQKQGGTRSIVGLVAYAMDPSRCNEESRRLFCLFGLMGADEVMRQDLAEMLKESLDEIGASKALAKLRSFGLCELVTEKGKATQVRVHGLLRAAAVCRLENDPERDRCSDLWARHFFGLVKEVGSREGSPEQRYQERDILRPRLAHILKAWEWADRLGMTEHLTTAAKGAGFLWREHQLDVAEKWLKKAIDIDEALGDRPKLTIDYNNMCMIEQARGRLDEAEGWLKKSIDIDEALGDQPALAIRYNNMSRIEQSRGRLNVAEWWLRKAIDIDEALGDPTKLAIRYNNMSQIEKDHGRLDEAEGWLKKAIYIAEALGDRPKLAMYYNNISQIQQARGRLDEAEGWLKKAIVIFRTLGDRFKLAALYNNMSQIEQDHGRLDDAEAWLKKAIDIAEALGDRPNLASMYNNMNQIEQARGRLNEAGGWLKKSFDIDEALGDKPKLAIRYNNMSLIEQARGRLEEAEEWMKKAIDIAEALGDRPNLAIYYNNMCRIEQDRGNPDGAEAWLDKAWCMIADLSPNQLRQDIGTAYVDMLLSRGKESAARAVRKRI